jgi:hypothetical protein
MVYVDIFLPVGMCNSHIRKMLRFLSLHLDKKALEDEIESDRSVGITESTGNDPAAQDRHWDKLQSLKRVNGALQDLHKWGLKILNDGDDGANIMGDFMYESPFVDHVPCHPTLATRESIADDLQVRMINVDTLIQFAHEDLAKLHQAKANIQFSALRKTLDLSKVAPAANQADMDEDDSVEEEDGETVE